VSHTGGHDIVIELPMAPDPAIPTGSGEVDYPRPVTSVHQIELTSRCNLRCVYCPSPKLDVPVEEGGFGREKVDMDRATFERAVEHAVHYQGQGTQNELALTGIGEPLLHPDFVELLAHARGRLPANLITFSTNGLALAKQGGEALLEAMKPYDPRIYVSTHRPEKAGLAIAKVKAAGLFECENTSFATDGAMDWAGQLDWPVQIPAGSVRCAYLGLGWCVVLADGRITTCCLDASGSGVVGHVDDEPGSHRIKPYSLCGPCHMVVP
jgi:Radical SAM superfamily/4Fe-4S single cluster domain